MSVNLITTSHQWATRPPDERYASLSEMLQAATTLRTQSRSVVVPLRSMSVVGGDNSLSLVGPAGNPAIMSYRAMTQLSTRIGAPTSYLRTLPSDLVATNLNHGLHSGGGNVQLLLRQNGALQARAVTGEGYARIWNTSVINRLIDLGSDWTVPPAHGDQPSGLYMGDRDLFAFLVNEKNRIQDGTEQGLARGIFAINSEVGEAAFQLWGFLYRYVCGNHIVWGAEQLSKVWIRHSRRAQARAMQSWQTTITEYLDSSATEEELKIKHARTHRLAATGEQLLDLVFGKKILSREKASSALTLATAHSDIDGDPLSAWGYTQGITRLSQESLYANERNDLDIAAGKVLSMAF